MIVVNCEQRTQAWHDARLGLATASNFHKIVTGTGKPTSGKTRDSYMNQLIAESMLGHETVDYVSDAMDRGLEMEPRGISEYEKEFNVTFKPVGFITCDDGSVGCSPDGLIEAKEGLDGPGGIELKCPLAHTHIGYLLDEAAFIIKHWQQVQGSMWITGRSWWNLVSYYPGMKLATALLCRNEEQIEALRKHIGAFNLGLAELRKKVAA